MRVFIYINKRDKHLTIHPETKKACGFLFKNFKKEGTITIKPTEEGGIFKLRVPEKSDNAFWLLKRVEADLNNEEELKREIIENAYIKDLINKHKIKDIIICSNCS